MRIDMSSKWCNLLPFLPPCFFIDVGVSEHNTRASLPGQERRAIGRQKFKEHVSIDMLKEEMGGGERKENKKTFFALANVARASGHHPSLFPLPFVSTFHRWLPTYSFSQPAEPSSSVHLFSKQPRRLTSRVPPDPPVPPGYPPVQVPVQVLGLTLARLGLPEHQATLHRAPPDPDLLRLPAIQHHQYI